MKEAMKLWRHVFKLDPDKEISDQHLDRLCQSETDAILVGGSTGTTFDNVVELLGRIRRYALPCLLEVSHAEAIVPGFDLYLIPMVLNARNPEWLFKPHVQALKEYGAIMDWDEIAMEGYVVLNPDSTVAQLTDSDTDLEESDVIAYARMVENMLRFPILYIEYSGTYGNIDLLQKVKKTLHETQLFYGGGIDSREKAVEASSLADTIVVGNIIYEDIERALSTVIKIEE